MHYTTFDTHKYVKELEASGFNEKQAEVIVKSLLESRDYDISKLATREQVGSVQKDIDILRKDMDAQFTSVRHDMDAQFVSVRKDMDAQFVSVRKDIDFLRKDMEKFATYEQVKAGLAEVKADIIKWIVPLFVAVIGMVASILIKLY